MEDFKTSGLSADCADTLRGWLQKSLPEDPSSYSIQIETIELKSGYLSNTFRANISKDDTATGNKRKLFIKTMPSDEETRGFISKTFLDETEIESYRTLFPELAAFEARVGTGGESTYRCWERVQWV